MQEFLKLKAWQMYVIYSCCSQAQLIVYYPGIAEMLSLIVWIGWPFVIGSVAYNRLPEGHGIKKTFFLVNCAFVIGSFLLFVVSEYGFKYSLAPSSVDRSMVKSVVYLLCVFYFIFAVFYIFSFAAKMLISSIKGEVAGFKRYFLYIFCFFLLPAGVWFIQPKARKLVKWHS